MSTSIEGERTVSPVTRKRRLSQRQTVALYVLVTAMLIGLVFWRNPARPPEEPRKMTQTEIRQLVQADLAPLPAPPPADLQSALSRPAPPAAPPQEAAEKSWLAPVMPNIAPKHVRLLSFEVASQSAASADPAIDGARQSDGAKPDRTTVAFKGVPLPGARAGAALDTTTMLMPGVYHCTLDTAISSDTAGPFMCHTSEEVRSPAGVTLMERGTVLVGEYKNEIRQGQGRLPALAVTAYTPNGVPVPLNAPMADGLGRVGLDGAVNNHLGARFGGAVLLLMTNGALGAAQAALTHGNNNTYLNLQSGSLDSAVSEVLRNSLTIPPTITKNQGEDVAFFVTAPIDFSAAYRLRSLP